MFIVFALTETDEKRCDHNNAADGKCAFGSTTHTPDAGGDIGSSKSSSGKGADFFEV